MIVVWLKRSSSLKLLESNKTDQDSTIFCKKKTKQKKPGLQFLASGLSFSYEKRHFLWKAVLFGAFNVKSGAFCVFHLFLFF